MAVAVVARAVQLQVVEQEFLQGQGDARHLRVAAITAHRGMILDRHGEPLAMSSPVESVWTDPGKLLDRARARVPELARLLGKEPSRLLTYLEQRRDREFVYLRRHVNPQRGRQVMDLALPGTALQREYRRFYPAGEVASHLLGFTDIDDVGQEGLELSFQDWLSGTPGAKRVVQDRLGRAIGDVERLRESEPGRSLMTAVDRRLQYLAYRELKAAVRRHRARSGSLVLLDARTGEVLAMVNQPAFNPNNRADIEGSRYRNRAVTDVVEPGSTLKPFTIAAALETGRYRPETPIDTGPGVLRVGGNPIRDVRDFGRIDVASVIRKSSNVGAAKIALSLEPGTVWEVLARLGFGRTTGSGFPGEVGGHLAAMPSDRPIERATLAFGYGVSATPLQLAHAYAAIAADGVMRPISFLKRDEVPAGQRVMSAATARAVRRMMEGVVSSTGTAPKAAISGYRIAGKTGTVKKPVAGGYAEERYVSLFAGLAPASDPRFVCVVTVDEPRGDVYYGGLVAAPVFREVIAGALRLYNVAPDAQPEARQLMAAGGDAP